MPDTQTDSTKRRASMQNDTIFAAILSASWQIGAGGHALHFAFGSHWFGVREEHMVVGKCLGL
jgi:hypothetical protein